MAEHEGGRFRRGVAAFLTGQTPIDEIPEAAKPPPEPVRATSAPLIPDDAPRRPATRIARPAAAAPPAAPAPVAVGPDGEEVPIVALPDHAAPPGQVISAGYDADGVEWVFEDDPYATPLVDPRYDADDRNWVRYRPSWGGALRIIGFAAILLLLVLAARNRIYGWLDDQLEAGGDWGEEVTFTIPEGAAVNSIATDLANADVINNATVFRYWLRCDGPNGGEITITGFLGCDTEFQFQAGDYPLHENMTYDQVFEVLSGDPIPEVRYDVLIPEGLRALEIRDRLLEENDLWDADEMAQVFTEAPVTSKYLPEDRALFWPYEGLLFPAVYDIPEQDLADEEAIVERMTNEMDTRIDRLIEEAGGLPPEAEALGYGPYEIVTIASLIEEEAKLDEERAQIARVIYNRLEADWTFGIDATACYARQIPCSELTVADLEDDNRWNTRVNPGLPFTPIAAPGEASLEAALNPADGPWMYYVLTDEDGSHTFATTEAEFEAARQVCIEKDLGCG